MLDAVYVDTIDKKGVVEIQPKPAFKALFALATDRDRLRPSSDPHTPAVSTAPLLSV
jgi:hypothetical protein